MDAVCSLLSLIRTLIRRDGSCNVCSSVICLGFVYYDTRSLLSFFFFSSRRRHTRFDCDWSSDVCSSDLLATGMSGKPSLPKIDGMDVFKGDQHHSSEHPGPDAYRGKKAVVIGSNNPAHDKCAALWGVGAGVPKVQRAPGGGLGSETL